MRASRANERRKKKRKNEIHPASFFAGIRCRRSAIGVSIVAALQKCTRCRRASEAPLHARGMYVRARVCVCVEQSITFVISGRRFRRAYSVPREYSEVGSATFISWRLPSPWRIIKMCAAKPRGFRRGDRRLNIVPASSRSWQVRKTRKVAGTGREYEFSVGDTTARPFSRQSDKI